MNCSSVLLVSEYFKQSCSVQDAAWDTNRNIRLRDWNPQKHLEQTGQAPEMLIHCEWESGYCGEEMNWKPDGPYDDGWKHGQLYWSVPAALLVRFLGDVFGEALSAKQEVRISFLFVTVIWAYCYYLWQLGTNMNILMTLRVSWGIQLMSTSLIPPVPLLYFHRESLSLQNTGSQTTSYLHPLACFNLNVSLLKGTGWMSSCPCIEQTHISQHMKFNSLLKTNTYRPRLQDLVYSEEHQGDQASQEHVEEHSAKTRKGSLE